MDINPIDLTSEKEVRWLRALVWPERLERAEMLTKAIDLATESPPKVLQGDSVTLLPGLLAAVPEDEMACVYQSYTLEYLSPDQREAFHAILDNFGAQRDLYFVEMSGIEPNGSLRLTWWQKGESRAVRLADCPPHGQWLRWLA